MIRVWLLESGLNWVVEFFIKKHIQSFWRIEVDSKETALRKPKIIAQTSRALKIINTLG